MFNWNDLKYLLAITRSGSTPGAAEALKVDQTTVLRRIEGLEKALGVQLFDRRPDGYKATAIGSELAAIAERVERETAAILNVADASLRRNAGILRVTTTELLATDILPPVATELRRQIPELQVELIASDRMLDLMRGEADIAIRVASVPAEPAVMRRKLGEIVWAIYCTNGYAGRHGAPKTIEELNRDHHIIEGSGEIGRLDPLLWVRALAPKAQTAIKCNSVAEVIAAVRAGAAIGPLPCFVAAGDANLVRCLPPHMERRYDVWLLYPESHRQNPLIRAFLDALIKRFAMLGDQLEGRCPSKTSA